VDSLNPLYHADVLPRVLSYAGPQQWLFIGLVSRMWRAAYRKLLREEANKPAAVTSEHEYCMKHKPACLTLTSRAQAFASATRLRFARACGLQWTAQHRGSSQWHNCAYDRITGKYCTLTALQAAVEIGMPLTADLADGVAHAHSLPKLQWLLTETTCPWDSWQQLSVAAAADDLTTLQWLTTQGAVPDAAIDFTYVKTMPVLQFYLQGGATAAEDACYEAAFSSSLGVLQWCWAQGYTFDSVGVGSAAASSGSLEKVQWLFNELKCSEKWSTADRTEMLQTAGANGHALPLCKWLREQGAEWPEMLSDPYEYKLWCEECVQWARGEGCTSPAIHYNGADVGADVGANSDTDSDAESDADVAGDIDVEAVLAEAEDAILAAEL
jgi:hypothetical protein